MAGLGLPAVIERLATYRNSIVAYRQIVARLNACTTLKGDIDDEPLTGTLEPSSFHNHGSASSAFKATFTEQGAVYGDDVVISRMGNIILGIDEAGIAPVNAVQFQSIVSNAARKVR